MDEKGGRNKKEEKNTPSVQQTWTNGCQCNSHKFHLTDDSKCSSHFSVETPTNCTCIWSNFKISILFIKNYNGKLANDCKQEVSRYIPGFILYSDLLLIIHIYFPVGIVSLRLLG